MLNKTTLIELKKRLKNALAAGDNEAAPLLSAITNELDNLSRKQGILTEQMEINFNDRNCISNLQDQLEAS